jgi:simple sugar transport system ATP-binding protein
VDRPPALPELARRLGAVAESYGLPLDPERPVHTLSVGERQRIEIARALLQDPALLVMDEPTSVLTPQEVQRLFETLRQLAAEGRSVLYISHKLEEVRALCGHATVLRRGRVVARLDPRAETAASLARAMIGTDVPRPFGDRPARLKRAPRLVVDALTLPPAGPHDVPFTRVHLEAQPGEIIGIAGVAGNGQRELAAALAGERLAPRPGMIRLDGQPVGDLGVDARRALGLCSLPEERNGTAAVPAFTLAENAVLGGWRRLGLAPRGILDRGAARAAAGDVIARFDVRTTGPAAAAASLSGGNLQKLVVGCQIVQEPTVLVAAQPTWGVDAGAAARIHAALRELAAAGAAVVVISQDLDEILALCERVAVLNTGHLSRLLPAAGASAEQVGLLMGGLHDLPAGGSTVAA